MLIHRLTINIAYQKLSFNLVFLHRYIDLHFQSAELLTANNVLQTIIANVTWNKHPGSKHPGSNIDDEVRNNAVSFTSTSTSTFTSALCLCQWFLMSNAFSDLLFYNAHHLLSSIKHATFPVESVRITTMFHWTALLYVVESPNTVHF